MFVNRLGLCVVSLLAFSADAGAQPEVRGILALVCIAACPLIGVLVLQLWGYLIRVGPVVLTPM